MNFIQSHDRESRDKPFQKRAGDHHVDLPSESKPTTDTPIGCLYPTTSQNKRSCLSTMQPFQWS